MQSGDSAKLNTSDRIMLIRRIEHSSEGSIALCVWFEGTVHHEGRFPTESLRKVITASGKLKPKTKQRGKSKRSVLLPENMPITPEAIYQMNESGEAEEVGSSSSSPKKVKAVLPSQLEKAAKSKRSQHASDSPVPSTELSPMLDPIHSPEGKF